MCRKSKIRCGGLFCLFCFVLVLSSAGSASADLVGHWTFDEGSGTVAYDSSGNGNDGTLQDDPTVVDGQSGQALAFEDSRISIGASDSLTADLFQGSFTLAAWINPKRTGNTWQQIFRSMKVDGSSNDTLFLNNDGRLSWRGFVGGAWTALCETATNVVPADQWTHFAVVGDGTNFRIYVDGALSQESAFQTTDGTNATYYIGGNPTSLGESYAGMIDEVRIYNHALLGAEITKLAARPRAWNPVPDDGAIYESTYVSCQWTAGDFAESHDVYFSDNYADVDAGTPDAFRGNKPLGQDYQIAGLKDFPYPTGLVAGTTYYWRVDEVKVGDPNSPWRGKIWSFSIPTDKANQPDPPDGVKFVDPSKQLSWTGGFQATLHQVYFGENFEDVQAGTPDTAKAQGPTTSYNPGPLANDTVYYWRVDETDTASATHTGDVWSFRTLPEISITDPNLLAWWKLDEGYGTTTVDWSGYGHNGTLANGAQWVQGYDGAAVQFDGTDDYVNLGTASELYLPENYTYVAWFKVGRDINGDSGPQYLLCVGSRSDLVFGVEDGVGVNGDLSLHYYDTAPGFHAVGVGQTVWSSDEWHMVAGTKDSATGHKIYLDGELMNSDTNTNNDNYNTTRMISLGARAWTGHQYYEGVIDDVRIYNKALTADEIKQIMRIDPLRAWNPSPANGSVPPIHEAVPLSWSPGDMASQHDVYFGTDKDAVENADASDTTGVYRGPQGAASYTPPEGVEWGGGPYYWRIDERNTDGTVSEGRVWSFTVADHLIVDDFEDYLGDEVPVTEQIWGVWRDGLGYGAVAAPPYYPGNGTGSEVGDVATTSYTEEIITHDGSAKSMPYVYNNNKPDKFKYSEAKMTLTATRDWTAEGVKALSLWFYGDSANAPEQMYVAVANNTGAPIVVPYGGEADNLRRATWQEWNIDLREFSNAGLNLADVNSIAIGFGDRNNPQIGGSGKVYFDDIRLYRTRCVSSLLKPDADLSGNCVVDMADVEIIANNWLISTYQVDPADPGTANLVGHWTFDNPANLGVDSTGNNNGTLSGEASQSANAQVGSGSLALDGDADFINVAGGDFFSALDDDGDGLSIAVWVRFAPREQYTVMRVFSTNMSGGGSGGWGFGIIQPPASLRFTTYGIQDYDTGDLSSHLPDGQWVHVAAVYKSDGDVDFYIDGAQAETITGNFSMNDTQGFLIGGLAAATATEWFEGLIDDLRIYDRELSLGEVGWLAGKTAPYMHDISYLLTPQDPAINAYDDGVIDLKDFAVLADQWLDELLWPQP